MASSRGIVLRRFLRASGQERILMPAIIHPPHIIQNAMDEFIADHFQNEPQRKHCANDLTGLFLAQSKTVAGITGEIVGASDQSCLNPPNDETTQMNEVEWDHEELNATRINWLQQFEGTKFSQNGIIALDDVLLDSIVALVAPTGKHIDDVGIMYDHAKKRHILAHDLLFANYVDPKSGKHYPLDFRRFKKEDQCESEEVDFKKQTELFRELVGWCHDNAIPGTFVFDSHYSSKEDLNYINSLKNDDDTSRAYVGDLMSNRIIVHKGVRQQINVFATTIPPEDRRPMQITGADGKQRTQYFLTVCVKMPDIDHKVRIVVIWKNREDAEAVKYLVTNRIFWNGEKIVEAYRYRWTGTETFHRDGKQELGLGDCQLRNGVGQTRHTYMVMLAHSLLVRELGNGSLREWCRVKLTTVGEACRELLRESIRSMVGWVMDELHIALDRVSSKRFEQLLGRLGLVPLR